MIGHKAVFFVPVRPCKRSSDDEDLDD